MSTVEVVLPNEYTNEWLLTVINAFDEVDIEVKFIKAPAKATGGPVYGPNILPVTTPWIKTDPCWGGSITSESPYTTTINKTYNITPQAGEYFIKPKLDKEYGMDGQEFVNNINKTLSENKAAFDRHKELKRTATDPWWKGETYAVEDKL